MIFNSRGQEWLGWISSRPMPIPSVILINPRSRPSSVCIYSGRQLNVRSVRDVRPDVSGHFIFRNCVRNAVSKPPSVNRGKVLCIPFRLHPAALQGPQASRAKRFSHLDGVVYNVNSHFAVIRHGFSPTLPTRKKTYIEWNFFPQSFLFEFLQT